MLITISRFTVAALTSLAGLGLAFPASAQTMNPNFRMPGVLSGGQQAQTMGLLSQATLPAVAATSASPYGTSPTAAGAYGNPYGGGYSDQGYPSYDPFSGYLRGVANVTQAQGQYQVTIQQARTTQAQADV